MGTDKNSTSSKLRMKPSTFEILAHHLADCNLNLIKVLHDAKRIQ